MGGYRVTIKVTRTFGYEVDDATSTEDAISQAFHDRLFWLDSDDPDEFSTIAEPCEPRSGMSRFCEKSY